MITYVGNPENDKLVNLHKVAHINEKLSIYEADNYAMGIQMFSNKSLYEEAQKIDKSNSSSLLVDKKYINNNINA